MAKRPAQQATADGPVDFRYGAGIPDRQTGISPAARTLAGHVEGQRKAWDSALRGMLSSPDHIGSDGSSTHAYAKEQMAKPDHGFTPQTAEGIQRTFNAIHFGSNGRSDGMGSVWRGNDAPRQNRQKSNRLSGAAPAYRDTAAQDRAESSVPPIFRPMNGAPASKSPGGESTAGRSSYETKDGRSVSATSAQQRAWAARRKS